MGPTPRFAHAMAYDPLRNVTVLFGGSTGGSQTNDTWEWNGSAWTQRSSEHAPPARSWHAMAYDPTRAAVLLFGGQGQGYYSDTWKWDGSAWEQVVTSMQPGPRFQPAMAFDPVRQQMLVNGGLIYTGGYPFTRLDTWVLGTPVAPLVQGFGTGCSATGVPSTQVSRRVKG